MRTLVDLLPPGQKTRRHVLRGLEKLVGDFRGEVVLFQTKWLSEKLEMKWVTVAKHIRDLTKLEPISYVPPFRGKAIHMRCRDKRFAELDIDFGELERRKKAEMDKLQSVIRLAQTRRCRQLEILEYFGDSDRRRCGSCDNCGSKPKPNCGNSKFADPGATLFAAQVTLSGIARTHGRIGKTLIAQMLKGSTQKKLKGMGLNRLSTFGLLKPLRVDDIVELIEFLIDNGFADQIETSKFRPVVRINAEGKTLMSGEIDIDLTDRMSTKLVDQIGKKLKGKQPHLLPTRAESEDKEEEAESEEELEAADDSVDEELDDSSAVREVSAAAMAGVVADERPVEESDADSADSDSDESDVEESPTEVQQQIRIDAAETSLPKPGHVRPGYFWTWRLLKEGYSLDHVMQIRQLEKNAVFDQTLRAAENGLQVEAGWLLDDSTQSILTQFIEEHEGKRLPQLLSALPDEVQPHELSLFLKTRQAADVR